MAGRGLGTRIVGQPLRLSFVRQATRLPYNGKPISTSKCDFFAPELYHHSRQLVHHHSDGPRCYACDRGEEYSFFEMLAACFGAEVFAANFAERAQLGDSLFRTGRGAAERFCGRLKGVIR
jgi:hypothetical protein